MAEPIAPQPRYRFRPVLDPAALVAVRERRGLTRSALAQAVGIRGGDLCGLETGRRNAAPAMLVRLAGALAVPVAALVHPLSPPPPAPAPPEPPAVAGADRSHTIDFGRRVRAARERTGWSQEKLAFVCGFHRTYIGNLERGEVNPNLYNLLRLATGLGVDPAELVGGLGPVELPPSPLAVWSMPAAGHGAS